MTASQPSSRSPVNSDLLFPGPQPPLSHLGITLLRHAVGTGVRYSLHQLGLPIPESPPLRIESLRLGLDESALRRLLGDSPGGGEVLAALLDPGGVADLDTIPGAVGIAGFHKVRMTLFPRRLQRLQLPKDSSTSDELAAAFRESVSAVLPALNDAFLAEILASLDRRARRARGASIGPCSSREAHRFLTGGKARSDRLGWPDIYRLSWADRTNRGDELASLTDEVPPPCRRGVFRELLRDALDRLRPLHRALAEDACKRGVLEEPDDSHFLPLDLVDSLAAATRPRWLDAAVSQNRLEYQTLLDSADEATREVWRASPLHPLP